MITMQPKMMMSCGILRFHESRRTARFSNLHLLQTAILEFKLLRFDITKHVDANEINEGMGHNRRNNRPAAGHDETHN